MNRRLRWFTLIGWLAIGFSSSLVAQSLSEKNLLAEVDRLRNFKVLDISCLLTVLTIKVGNEKSVIEGRYFRRDREDKFTMILTDPSSKRGQGYLQAGDNLWFYDPTTRAFAHSSLKENFSDSKARNDDFSSTTYARDYKILTMEEGKLGAFPVFIATIGAVNDLVPYAKQKIWVRKDLPLVLKQECYATSGKLLVTYAFPSYTNIDGTYVPGKIYIRDELVKGESSEISLNKISVGTLADTYFTKGFLEQNGR
jgi:outer membrane lipoprotein-sorting protein